MMKRKRAYVLGSIISSLVILSCGGAQTPADLPAAAAFLPTEIPATEWTRMPEIRHFVGDTLYEYIDGAAEMYHTYGFIEVTVADYQSGPREIVVDLYRFGEADMAYGMFTTLRPEEPDTVALGVTGFSFGPTLAFVKGTYIASFVGYDESPETISAIRVIAEGVARLLPGTTDKPAMFSSFPPEAPLEHTEKIFAESFLGREYLSGVYCVDYVQDGDTLTLFLMADEAGGKYAQWFEQTAGDRTSTISTQGLPYDEGNVFIIVDGYYGHIAAGLKAGKLAGIIGYGQKHAEFLTAWVNSLH